MQSVSGAASNLPCCFPLQVRFAGNERPNLVAPATFGVLVKRSGWGPMERIGPGSLGFNGAQRTYAGADFGYCTTEGRKYHGYCTSRAWKYRERARKFGNQFYGMGMGIGDKLFLRHACAHRPDCVHDRRARHCRADDRTRRRVLLGMGQLRPVRVLRRHFLDCRR